MQLDAYKGYNGTIVITDSGIIIKRGTRGFLLGGGKIRGDKTIPFSSIIAVQYKKPGITVGYLQLTLRGGSEAKAGLKEAIEDENTVTFASKRTGLQFLELKNIIEDHLHQDMHAPKHDYSLRELDQLKKDGILTEAEFNAKKKQILGL